MEADIVYSNKFNLGYEEYLPPELEYSYVDSFFSIFDFVIQIGILSISLLNILTKEGYIDTLNPDSDLYL